MRKLFATFIALTMILSMSVTAFAAEGGDTGNKPGESHSIEVTAKTKTSTSTETVYSVDIAWEIMTFSYTETGTKTWNPVTHTYSTTTESKWNKTEADITVTNHSNAAVFVKVKYTPVDGTGVTGTITNGTKILAAGVENDPDGADKLVATLTISGTPTHSVTAAGVKVGSITVTIGK